MAGRVIATIDDLRQYLSGVAQRADHHGGNVDEIVMAVAGCLVLYKDRDSEIRVVEHQGETKNVLWVHLREHRYALSYNHQDQAVEVRDGAVRGDVLAAFSNNSSTGEVIALFRQLSGR